jgi:two-component system osmolarity sensor histidine kinase EnvZ
MGWVKKILPRTLLGRSLIILIVPVVLIQVITTYIFFDRHWNKMNTRLAYALSGEIAAAYGLIQGDPSPENVQKTGRYFQNFLDLSINYDAGAQLPGKKSLGRGAIWETTMAKKLRTQLDAQIQAGFVIHTDFDGGDIAVYVQLEDGVLKISFPQRRLFSSSGYVFLLWMMGSSLLLLLVAMLFMRNQIRPIRKLAVAAERFGKGRDTPSFKPEGALEVRQAANAFLDMRRRIQRQISQRTEMLAGVSHDLRTPLTRMKLQLEMLPDSQDVRDLKTDVYDMERMIHGYLDFVRGDGDEQYAAVEIVSLFEKLAAGLKHQNVSVSLDDVEKGLRLMVRPMAFERALGNIINNASKYAQHIWVKASQEDKKIQIQIEDDGPGIPEALYDDVFKPFVRGDSSRNAETGGVGLGLAITMDIVHAHGGKITLSPSSYGGLCVTVRMP